MHRIGNIYCRLSSNKPPAPPLSPTISPHSQPAKPNEQTEKTPKVKKSLQKSVHTETTNKGLLMPLALSHEEKKVTRSKEPTPVPKLS